MKKLDLELRGKFYCNGIMGRYILTHYTNHGIYCEIYQDDTRIFKGFLNVNYYGLLINSDELEQCLEEMGEFCKNCAAFL